jgi:hypothetical protein
MAASFRFCINGRLTYLGNSSSRSCAVTSFRSSRHFTPPNPQQTSAHSAPRPFLSKRALSFGSTSSSAATSALSVTPSSAVGARVDGVDGGAESEELFKKFHYNQRKYLHNTIQQLVTSAYEPAAGVPATEGVGVHLVAFMVSKSTSLFPMNLEKDFCSAAS